MNLRLMGSTDLVTKWAELLEHLGLPGQVYPQRQGSGARLYVTVDDRQAQVLAERLAAATAEPARTVSPRAKLGSRRTNG
jgi:hypothetical protein